MKKTILLICFIVSYNAFGSNNNFSFKKINYNVNKVENDTLKSGLIQKKETNFSLNKINYNLGKVENDSLTKGQTQKQQLKKAFQKEVNKVLKGTSAQKFNLHKNKSNSQVDQLEGILFKLNNRNARKQSSALEFDKNYINTHFLISDNEKEILDKAKEVTAYVEKNNRFSDGLNKADPSAMPIGIKQEKSDDFEAIIVIDELKIEDLSDDNGKEPKLTMYAKITLKGTEKLSITGGGEEEQVLYFYSDDVDVSSTGGVPEDTRLYLLSNVALTKDSSNWLLSLSRGVDADGSLNKAATSATINCEGITKFNYALDVRISRKLIIPTDEEGNYTCDYDITNRKNDGQTKAGLQKALKSKKEVLKKAKKDKDTDAVKKIEADIKKYEKRIKDTNNKGVDQSGASAIKKGVKNDDEINKLKATKTKLEGQRKEKKGGEKDANTESKKKKLSKQLKSLDTNIKRLSDQIERKTKAKKEGVTNGLTESGKAFDENAVGNPCYVGAKVNFKGSSLGDFLVDLTLPNFEAVNLPGYTFSLEQLVFDNSIKNNSGNLDLSDEYKEKIGDDGEKTWQGFYAKKLKVILPKSLSKFGNSKSDTRRALDVEGLVVDKRGVTGDFSASNVLGIDDGKIGDFAVSIDKLTLRILTNTFYGVDLEGKLKLPLVDSTMVYSGKYDKEEFAAKIELEEDAVFTAKAIRSRLTLKKNSYLQIEYKKDGDDAEEKEWLPEASLTGALEVLITKSDSKATAADKAASKESMKSKKEALKKAKQNKDTEAVANIKDNIKKNQKPLITVGGVTFEELKITKDDIDFKSIGIKKGTKMEGFPIQLNELAFIKPQKGSYGLKVDVGLSLMKESKSKEGSEDKKEMTGFKASGAFHVFAKRTKKDGYSFDRFEFNKISLKGEFAKLGVEGSIEYVSDDPDYGTGFQGEIELDIKTMEAVVTAKAVFGVAKNKKKEDYKYWYFDVAYINNKEADAAKKFNLKMLMGGANFHMKQKSKTGDKKKFTESSAGDNTYIPDDSMGLGFRAGIGFSLQGESTFAAMALLNMQFTKSWGVSRIQIIGAGGLMSKPTPADPDDKNLAAAKNLKVEKDSSKGSLELALEGLNADSYVASAKIGFVLGIDLDFENNIYQGVLEGYMKTPSFRGAGDGGKLGRITFYYAKGKKWYVFAGDRENRLGIVVPIPTLQPLAAKVAAYFMTGRSIEAGKDSNYIKKVTNIPKTEVYSKRVLTTDAFNTYKDELEKKYPKDRITFTKERIASNAPIGDKVQLFPNTKFIAIKCEMKKVPSVKRIRVGWWYRNVVVWVDKEVCDPNKPIQAPKLGVGYHKLSKNGTNFDNLTQSISVPQGYQFVGYENENRSGWKVTYGEGKHVLNSSKLNKLTEIEVKKVKSETATYAFKRQYVVKKEENVYLGKGSTATEFYKFGLRRGVVIEGEAGPLYWEFKLELDQNLDIAKYHKGIKKCVDGSTKTVGKFGWYTSGDMEALLSGEAGMNLGSSGGKKVTLDDLKKDIKACKKTQEKDNKTCDKIKLPRKKTIWYPWLSCRKGLKGWCGCIPWVKCKKVWRRKTIYIPYVDKLEYVAKKACKAGSYAKLGACSTYKTAAFTRQFLGRGKFKIVEASITMRLNFEFPNSSVLGGLAKVDYNVLGGTVKGTAQLDILLPLKSKPCSFKH